MSEASTSKKASLIALLLIVSTLMIFGIFKLTTNSLSSSLVFGNNDAGVTASQPATEVPIAVSDSDSATNVTRTENGASASALVDGPTSENLENEVPSGENMEEYDRLNFEIVDHMEASIVDELASVRSNETKDVTENVTPVQVDQTDGVLDENVKESQDIAHTQTEETVTVTEVQINESENVTEKAVAPVNSKESHDSTLVNQPSASVERRSIETQTENFDDTNNNNSIIEDIVEKIIDDTIVTLESTPPLQSETVLSTTGIPQAQPAEDVNINSSSSPVQPSIAEIVSEPSTTLTAKRFKPFVVLESLDSLKPRQLKYVYLYVSGFKVNSVKKSITKLLDLKLLESVSISADEIKGEATISFSEKEKKNVSSKDISAICSKLKEESSSSSLKYEMRINKKHITN